MNKIIYGNEDIEDLNHFKPTIIYRRTNSKCLYYRKTRCLMACKCRHQKFKDNLKVCSVYGRSNICLRLV